mmetsp:Transcript_17061/g.57639  ORF Transcript_17061/g.57639 Transcript_17061/m.57639 type:complete len:222 (-) Transcript_17061:2748-3413(-)
MMSTSWLAADESKPPASDTSTPSGRAVGAALGASLGAALGASNRRRRPTARATRLPACTAAKSEPSRRCEAAFAAAAAASTSRAGAVERTAVSASRAPSCEVLVRRLGDAVSRSSAASAWFRAKVESAVPTRAMAVTTAAMSDSTRHWYASTSLSVNVALAYDDMTRDATAVMMDSRSDPDDVARASPTSDSDSAFKSAADSATATSSTSALAAAKAPKRS